MSSMNYDFQDNGRLWRDTRNPQNTTIAEPAINPIDN
jgi:hypothetical protein